MKQMMQIAVGAALMALTLTAAAQKPIVYPAKGQSAQQQSKDDGECYVWAKQNTGVDPAAPPPKAAPVAAPPPPPPGRGLVRGAAAGAAIGAIGGNDVGNAAAKGAVIGGVAQASRRRGQEQQAAQQQAANEQQAQGQQKQNLDAYYRAYGACMSGRGYTLN